MALRVTSERVRDVRFAEQWRGYRTEEVDEFVEQVADALDELEGLVREATERAALAERQLGEQGPVESLQRTLVLAQRTADAALEEAKSEAARLVAEAEERSRSVLERLEERRANIEGEVEARMSAELAEVSDRREALESDLELLASYVLRSRERLVQDLQAQLQWLQQNEPLDALPSARPPLEPPPPRGSSGAAPTPASAGPADGEPAPLPGSSNPMAGEASGTGIGGPVPEGPATMPDAGVLETASGETAGSNPAYPSPPVARASVEVGSTDSPPTDSPPTDSPSDDTALDDLDVIPWSDAGDEVDGGGGGDALVPGGNDGDDDPFIAELRRAVDDPEPLGPRDDSVEWSDDVDLFDRRREGSKRSRRRR